MLELVRQCLSSETQFSFVRVGSHVGTQLFRRLEDHGAASFRVYSLPESLFLFVAPTDVAASRVVEKATICHRRRTHALCEVLRGFIGCALTTTGLWK